MEKKYSVYSLTDPIDLKIKYVGCTKNVLVRYTTHLVTSKTHRDHHNKGFYSWISYLRSIGARPILNVIKEFESQSSALSMEKLLIGKLGNQLFNKQHNHGK